MSAEMGTATKVGGFVALAAAVFGLAIVVGKVVGPIGDDDEATGAGHGHDSERISLSPVETYALDLTPTRAAGAGAGDLTFTVRDSKGAPVTAYDVQHEKLLHLVVVRRDLGAYRHVHPTLGANGEWSVPIDLDPGVWRVYADFKPTDGAASLAESDLSVAGDYEPAAQGADNDTASVDGYEVHLSQDDGMLALHVQRDGVDVTDLEPYLGAFGHLVAIRAEDMTYLHVHPQDGPAGPEVAFHTALDEPGRYRLFFEFQTDGTVHRAEFNLTVDAGAEKSPGGGHDMSEIEEEGGSGEHDH